MFTPTEVLNHMDRQFNVAKAVTVTDNSIKVEINGVEDKKHYIGSIALVGTAGTGGAESLVIKKGTDTAWEESFTVGEDKVRQFQAVPFVGNEGESVTVEASATDLTAGKLYVVYYTK